MITELKWDSDFFGYKVGMLHHHEGEFSFDIFKKASTDFHLIYVFSREPIPFDNINNNFYHVDSKVVFQKSLSYRQTQPISCEEYQYDQKTIDKVLSLAYQSGEYSRFKTDTNFKNNEFVRLYEKWVLNSLNRINGSKLLVHYVKQEIAGFITISQKGNNTAQIGLIAVDHIYRGQGIGKSLIEDAQNTACEMKCDKLEVATQKDNNPAMRFYKKNGFEVKETIYVYHYWKK